MYEFYGKQTPDSSHELDHVDHAGLTELLESNETFLMDIGRANDPNFPRLLCERDKEGKFRIQCTQAFPSTGETSTAPIKVERVSEIIQQLYGIPLEKTSSNFIFAAMIPYCNAENVGGFISVFYHSNHDEQQPKLKLSANFDNLDEDQSVNHEQELELLYRASEVWLNLFYQFGKYTEPLITELSLPKEQEQPPVMTGLDRVGGLFEVKRAVQELISKLQDPADVREYYQQGPPVVLLSGDRGTGKSTLVRGLSEELDAKIEIFQPSDRSLDGNAYQQMIKWIDKLVEESSPDKAIVAHLSHPDSLLNLVDLAETQRKAAMTQLGNSLKAARQASKLLIVIESDSTNDIEWTMELGGLKLLGIATNQPNQFEMADIITTLTSGNRSFVYDDEPGNKLYGDDIDEITLSQELSKLKPPINGADIEKILEYARDIQYAHYRTTGEKLPVTQAAILQSISEYC